MKESPGGRIATGDGILEAAKTTNTSSVKTRLAAFKKVHGQYVTADQAVKKAGQALATQEHAAGVADSKQDAAVDALASALAGDGLPRQNPFRPLGFAAPDAIKRMGYAAEAKLALELAAAVAGSKSAGSGSKAKAKALASAAAAVQLALKPLPKLRKAVTSAMIRRNALALPWEAAYSALKDGCKSAEHDGAQGLTKTLFVSVKRKPKAKSKTKTQTTGATGDANAPPLLRVSATSRKRRPRP